MLKGINFGSMILMTVASAGLALVQGGKAHATVERWVTIPEEQRDDLFKKLDPKSKAKAEAIAKRIADDVSDLALLVATDGKVQPD